MMQSQILCGDSMGRGNESFYKMTKMATMPIYDKNLKKSSPEQVNDLETWLSAGGTQALQRVHK